MADYATASKLVSQVSYIILPFSFVARAITSTLTCAWPLAYPSDYLSSYHKIITNLTRRGLYFIKSNASLSSSSESASAAEVVDQAQTPDYPRHSSPTAQSRSTTGVHSLPSGTKIAHAKRRHSHTCITPSRSSLTAADIDISWSTPESACRQDQFPNEPRAKSSDFILSRSLTFAFKVRRIDKV
jgi:hypothetical protein